MFGDLCRHCSMEKTSRSFTVLGKDPKTQLFVPLKQSKVTVDLGAFCNNISMWVEDMHYCPSRWALYRGVDKPKEKTPIKKKKPIVRLKKGTANKKIPMKKKVKKTHAKRQTKAKVEG